MFYQDDQSHLFSDNFRIHLPLTRQPYTGQTFQVLNELMGKYISSPIEYDTNNKTN